jgi:hypothetical protein
LHEPTPQPAAPQSLWSGTWTAPSGVMSGTFTKLMPTPDGKSIAPMGRPCSLGMVAIGHRIGGTVDHEWLIWDNQDFMNQIGLWEASAAKNWPR